MGAPFCGEEAKPPHEQLAAFLHFCQEKAPTLFGVGALSLAVYVFASAGSVDVAVISISTGTRTLESALPSASRALCTATAS